MSVAWTKEQRRVIDVRNKNVLVSAAASAANAVPENISAEDTSRVPKNRNTLTARAVL